MGSYVSELAKSYDQKRRIEKREFQRILEYVRHYGKVTGKILDVGCGTGFYLVPLARKFKYSKFYGIDSSVAMLTQMKTKVAKGRLNNCSIVRGAAEWLPFPDERFDLVMLCQVLHYFEELDTALLEVNRVTRIDGRVLIITCSHLQMKSTMDLMCFPKILQKDLKRVPSIHKIKRIFERMGFRLSATVEFAVSVCCKSFKDLVELVRQKPYSSYLQLTNQEFESGIREFERKLRERYGNGELIYLIPQTLIAFEKSSQSLI